MSAKKHWTKEEDEYLKANYMTKSYPALAEELNTSKFAIAFRITKVFKLIKSIKIRGDHTKNKKVGTYKGYRKYITNHLTKS